MASSRLWLSATPAKLCSISKPVVSLIGGRNVSLSFSKSTTKFNVKPVKTKALGDSTGTTSPTYNGVYGAWTVDDSDVREVLLYRAGLVTAATSFVSASFLAASSDQTSGSLLDALYSAGGCGLGLSLFLIHIYVTEIKRTLQALWALGAVGSVLAYTALAAPSGQSLVQYVIHNPAGVWLVGPLFAALTGLVFKEGLCYGKLEAALLTFIIPSLLLGHLSGLMDDSLKLGLLAAWSLLFVVFATRKFSQPIKDDIGDKSVFLFNALPEDQKNALIQKLEQQKLDEKLE